MSRGNISYNYAMIGTHYPQYNKQDEHFTCHVLILLFKVCYNFHCCQYFNFHRTRLSIISSEYQSCCIPDCIFVEELLETLKLLLVPFPSV